MSHSVTSKVVNAIISIICAVVLFGAIAALCFWLLKETGVTDVVEVDGNDYKISATTTSLGTVTAPKQFKVISFTDKVTKITPEYNVEVTVNNKANFGYKVDDDTIKQWSKVDATKFVEVKKTADGFTVTPLGFVKDILSSQNENKAITAEEPDKDLFVISVTLSAETINFSFSVPFGVKSISVSPETIIF